jgi:dTDP-4-amino-4,6-dideoxygalactose transaminase
LELPFERRQAIRRGNFERLRELMSGIACLEPLPLHPGVRAHGMYMFAMRYRPRRCGDAPIDVFVELVQAEGAPIHRAFAATISDQPAMQRLARKRPEYFRRQPTPVADQAVSETLFIPQNVFLGGAGDMEDIVAAVRKVETHCSGQASCAHAAEAA